MCILKNTNTKITENRKAEHIEICLNKDVEGENVWDGFHEYRFLHNALPEINFKTIDYSSHFLGKSVTAPFIISSMTGGTTHANKVNRHLAEAAETRGWAMGVGSMRAYIENEQLAGSYRIRDVAPTIPIFANIGAVQLNYGFGIEECKKAVELIDADALVLHLNSLQEVIQPEGDTNFEGLLGKIEYVCQQLEVPVGVKEIGWGISSAVAKKLKEAGVSFIDVAGAGGTSWTQVEKHRTKNSENKALGDSFSEWGIPTPVSIQTVRETLPHMYIIGSGGITNGIDAAKAIALGADSVGFGRVLLESATHSVENTLRLCSLLEKQLQLVMFGIGCRTIQELKHSDALIHV